VQRFVARASRFPRNSNRCRSPMYRLPQYNCNLLAQNGCNGMLGAPLAVFVKGGAGIRPKVRAEQYVLLRNLPLAGFSKSASTRCTVRACSGVESELGRPAALVQPGVWSPPPTPIP
jgi:hypothetical protein